MAEAPEIDEANAKAVARDLLIYGTAFESLRVENGRVVRKHVPAASISFHSNAICASSEDA